mmetsp:Transcript_3184/g.2744  ORF Transcript_3184/g.2744 Transcript_3184/m.2744 type:complete len:98 (+) Transcript_3184:319-612(+)
MKPLIVLAHHKNPGFNGFKALSYFENKIVSSQNHISLAIHEGKETTKIAEEDDNKVNLRVGENKIMRRQFKNIGTQIPPLVPEATRKYALVSSKVIS